MTRSRVFAILGPVFLTLAALLALGALLALLLLLGENPPARSEQPRWLVSMVLASIATPFGLVGSAFVLLTRWSKRKQAALIAHGEKLSARVVGLERSFVRINHRRAHVLVCSAHSATRGALTLRSEPLLADAAEWVGRELTAYVDRTNGGRYTLLLDEPTR